MEEVLPEYVRRAFYWVDHFNAKAKDIHKISLIDDGSDKVPFVNTDRGIQAHYVFTRDGVIQRGRPINLRPWNHLTEGYSENSIWIQFVGGIGIEVGMA